MVSTITVVCILLMTLVIVVISARLNRGDKPMGSQGSNMQVMEEEDEMEGGKVDISGWFSDDGANDKAGVNEEQKETSSNSADENSEMKEYGDELSESWGPIY